MKSRYPRTSQHELYGPARRYIRFLRVLQQVGGRGSNLVISSCMTFPLVITLGYHDNLIRTQISVDRISLAERSYRFDPGTRL